MGLDMYLYCNSRTLTQRVHEGEPYGEFVTEFYKRNGIVMYWRKANAIHKWFVDNVQDGKDECEIHEVSWDKLTELRNICKDVLDHHDAEYAMDVLPPQSGFFFGSTEVNEWYWDDLERTVKEIDAIDKLLDDAKWNGWPEKVVPDEPDWCVTFQYQSSW